MEGEMGEMVFFSFVLKNVYVINDTTRLSRQSYIPSTKLITKKVQERGVISRNMNYLNGRMILGDLRRAPLHLTTRNPVSFFLLVLEGTFYLPNRILSSGRPVSILGSPLI